MKYFLLLTLFLLLQGCYKTSDEDDLRTVPVTNNPNYIIDSGKTNGIPGMGY